MDKLLSTSSSDDCEKEESDEARGDPEEHGDDREAEIEGEVLEESQPPEGNHETESLISPEIDGLSQKRIYYLRDRATGGSLARVKMIKSGMNFPSWERVM